MPVSSLSHDLPFDPAYGYDLKALLKVGAPSEPDDLVPFWQQTYRESLQTPLRIERRRIDSARGDVEVFEIEFDSWNGVRIGGWLTLPRDKPVERGVVHSHGYGGNSGPDLNVAGPPAAVIFPCARGLPERSLLPGIPEEGHRHVLVGIESRETYIHRGCVADIWCAASALLELAPQAAKHLHFIGGSFGGGTGAMALAWDSRFSAGALGVPSFGNHPLRVTLPCTGSGESVRLYHQRHPEVLEVLKYHDAAIMARYIHVPVLCDCALFDPAVPPPGQFAVYNAIAGPKQLFTRRAGHFSYPEEGDENAQFHKLKAEWFSK